MPHSKILDRPLVYRYEFPEDRFMFWRWREAAGIANKLPYWQYDGQKQVLHIELRKREHRLAVDISGYRLDMDKRGWRCVVADELRRIRRKLRLRVENGALDACVEHRMSPFPYQKTFRTTTP